jgi:hypothetical protein
MRSFLSFSHLNITYDLFLKIKQTIVFEIEKLFYFLEFFCHFPSLRLVNYSMTSEDSESVVTVYLRLTELGLALLVMDLNLTCSTSVSRCTSTFELSAFRYAIGVRGRRKFDLPPAEGRQHAAVKLVT